MFLQPNAKNFHVQYFDVNRHWSPRSEKFAGADSLITAMNRGWAVSEDVVRHEHWHAGVRCVSVYHFTLRRDDTEITMPIIENPYVTRLLWSSEFNVVNADPNSQNEQRVG